MTNEIKQHLKLIFQINFDRCDFHLPLKYFIENFSNIFRTKVFKQKHYGLQLELFLNPIFF